MIDLRFPTALQMMLLLAVADQAKVPSMSSAQLANGVGIQASFVRKLLVPLVKGGLVLSARGKTGGVHLAHPADEITLQDIYRAIVGDKNSGKRVWTARVPA